MRAMCLIAALVLVGCTFGIQTSTWQAGIVGPNGRVGDCEVTPQADPNAPPVESSPEGWCIKGSDAPPSEVTGGVFSFLSSILRIFGI